MTAKTIRLPEDLDEWLRREAFDRRTSQQSIIEEALRRLMRAGGVPGPTFGESEVDG